MADWIWKRGDTAANTRMCFVKDFDCTDAEGTATARISADSRYILYINGKTVVYEGGQKRGLTPTSTYYDEIDLSGCFMRGKNRIAVLVWYFGKDGFSHVSSGQGGLYFDAEIGCQNVCSGADWKVKRYDAYLDISDDKDRPNFRLPESDICFDASLDMGKWYEPGYDVSDWEDAFAYGDNQFGRLVKRVIPMFRYSQLKDFVNTKSVKGLRAEKDMVLDMRLPYNLQFQPYLMVNADAGKTITIRTENYYTNAPGENCLKCVYKTKDGPQEYEFPGWINGEHALFEIPAGVTVIDLKYRETEYDVSPAGSFECDDVFYSRLWEKSYRTLHICMRDTFMDCPNRERAQWWGDANIEMEMALYSMDDRAKLLYENGVRTLAGWYDETGIMQTVAPSGNMQFDLPFQNLAGICGFMVYYRHTGNIGLIRSAYDMSVNYVMRFDLGSDGLVVHRTGSWDWPDWGDNADIAVMENAWYCLALDACAEMAELTEHIQDADIFRQRARKIRSAVTSKLQDGVFYSHTDNGIPDDRANALAVLAQFDCGSDNSALVNVLAATENSSPYMEKYVYDALCETSRADIALERMKRRYKAITEDSYSTLWELWNNESSLNHGWSGGPIVTLGRYIAGIQAESAHRYRIAPQPCGLKHIRCTVPTVLGKLSGTIDRDPEGSTIAVDYPEGLTISAVEPRGRKDEKWNIVLRSI